MDQGTSEALHKEPMEEERCLALCNGLILSNVLNKVNPGSICKFLKTLGPSENANSPNSFTTQENSPEKGRVFDKIYNQFPERYDFYQGPWKSKSHEKKEEIFGDLVKEQELDVVSPSNKKRKTTATTRKRRQDKLKYDGGIFLNVFKS
ncbi:hypothetical protein OROHE_016138 [Orobanche hederae]